MRYKFTILTFLWMLLMHSLPVQGNSGDFHEPESKSYSSSFVLEAPPPAGFTYVTNGGCVPVTVQFYSQLNGPAYSWTFGDGGTSTDCNPVHTYLLPGTYTVTLVATGGTYTTTITVGANPDVTFTGDSFSCQNDVRNYSITSTIPAASYSWSAQGGTVTASTITTATVTWSNYGVNYLSYTMTTAAGCTRTFRYKVKVLPPAVVNLPCCDKKRVQEPTKPDATGHQEPVPGGSEPCDVCAGSYQCYQTTIDPEFGTAGDYNWNWTVTNGTIASISSDSTKICVVWGTSGTGTIKLEMINKQYGCKSIKECEVTIAPGITPVFTVSGNCINTPVYFDAAATSPLSDITGYFWEFGDGYTATTADPFTNHEFTLTGTYTATLTITTKKGCEYKVKRTFSVISGTKPEIVCPGTVCEGSRQCYSTAMIAGATYTWQITGDVPSERIITNNEVCVTWGTGPVGTVTVTVTGGGYTCTNYASAGIAIVGSVIPVNGPDFICQTTGYMEVSTTNYTGACYKWSINGTSQASTTNVLTFNAAAYGNPIVVDVTVDYPLGCCHGRGRKVIRKLPQYTMNTYPFNVCIGSTATYTLGFPAGLPASAVSWSVEGGTIVSFNASSVTVNWTTEGTGSITAGNNSPGQYCNDGTNNTWTVKVWEKATGEDISGPATVCAGNAYTYFHGYGYPTGSTTVSVFPSAGVSAGPYSSVISFPAVATPTTYTISVTYNHSVVGGCNSTKTYTVVSVPTNIPAFTIPPGVVCQDDIVTYTCAMANTSFYGWEVIGGSILSETYSGGILTLQVQWNSTVTSGIKVTHKVCGTSNTQNIVVNGKPVVIITTGNVVCGAGSVGLSVAPIWASYSWSTGSMSSTTSVTTPGTYSVTVSNGVCSNTGSAYVPVVIPVPPVINSFTITPPPTNYCPKYNRICPNITPGTGGIVSYSWTFTGFTATSSTAVCPEVALTSNPGTGNWSLTITDSYGCTSTLTGSLTDNCIPVPGCPQPYAGVFNITGYDPCSGQFTTTSTNVTDVGWDFGDGTLGGGFAPVHIYTSACAKTVSCTARDINGCLQVFTFTINVPYTISNPKITAGNTTCTGASTLTASGISVCPTSGLVPLYTWTVTPAGGGTPVYVITNTTSSTLNVGTIPAIPNGDFMATVQMTVAGCSRTVSINFNKGGLQAYFVSCGGCANSPLTFIDQSSPYLAPIIQWSWAITGPATFNSFLQNPTIQFPTNGMYNVSLTVTDNNLCTHTYSTNIQIDPTFVAGDIIVNGSSTPSGTSFNICPGDNYTLTAPPGTSFMWSTGSSAPSIAITEPGEYSVTVFNSDGCADKVGPIKFFYKPAPEAIILTSTDECAPRLLRAFTGTGYNYQWNYAAGTFYTTYINLYNSDNVTLKVGNVHGCVDVVTQFFNVNPRPAVNVTYAPAPFCPGNTVTLNAAPFGGTPPYMSYLWNNGNTTNSITTSTPGLYINTVTDSKGCTGSGQLNLQPVLPPGMDKLPYGCFDVCQAVSFCTGSMPYGWTGQWYLDANPYGASIPQGGSIAIAFTAPGSYTLHYIPVNPAVACPAVSKPITLTFISLPTFTITPADAVLCKNSGQGVLLTVDIQDPMYSYTWYLDGVEVGTGYTYNATTGGTYTVEIGKNPCCKTTAVIEVREINCCFENPGVPFKQFLSDTTIYTNEFWHDKYYIDAVVTVAGNAELDLTNVDVVFGINGRIVFTDQAFFRCNNSVLRPCQKDNVWPGLQFFHGASGWINTTTIKNAVIGVYIENNERGVRLSDNSFLKCNTSVFIFRSYEQQSISGNTFEIDETALPYPSNEYWAIKLVESSMKGLISQNSFRHVQPQKTSNIYYGIYGDHTTFTASQNQFNDMYRAIDVMNNWNVVAIEENTIKVNQLKETYDLYQIRVTNCENPVLIYENTMDNGIGNNSVASAIYCERTYRTHIKDNQLNGFYEGIKAVRTQNIHITSNTITSNKNMGIGVEATEKSIISCNSINSMSGPVLQSGGPLFGITDWNGNGSSQIYANCIFNMNTSIDLRTPYDFYRLPAVMNNYLYNYTQNGIYNSNYFGDIGTPGGATNAGRNTFMSNNGATGSTFDINSNVWINEGGNYGILMTNNVNSTTGNDEYYSTSACGHQIQQSYPSNQMDQYNMCDIYFYDKWIRKDADGKYALIESTKAITPGMINEGVKAGQYEVVGMITSKMQLGSTEAKRAGDAVLSSAMDKNLAARLVVTNCIAIGDVPLAAAFLADPRLSDVDADLREVLDITIAVAGKTILTSSQYQVLTGIDNQNKEYSPLAREIMQAYNGEHDYKFPKAAEKPVFEQPENVLLRQQNSISVYPVPAMEQVFLEHNVKDATVKGVQVLSMMGAEVFDFDYTLQAGKVSIDISKLAPGMYSVVLITDSSSKIPMTGRFIKLQ